MKYKNLDLFIYEVHYKYKYIYKSVIFMVILKIIFKNIVNFSNCSMQQPFSMDRVKLSDVTIFTG